MAVLKDVVAKRRRALRRTQRQVALDVGISAGYLGMIESGKVGIPSPDVMAGLARALDMPEEELLKSVGYLENDGADYDAELALAEAALDRILTLETEAEQLEAFRGLPLKLQRKTRAIGALVLREERAE